jgi:hypothetical protein
MHDIPEDAEPSLGRPGGARLTPLGPDLVRSRCHKSECVRHEAYLGLPDSFPHFSSKLH